jgi:Pilus formation protein N terminal region
MDAQLTRTDRIRGAQSMTPIAFAPRRTARSLAVALTVAAGVGAYATMPAAVAQDLIVKYDQSQLLRLSRPVAEIIVGNPAIADITVQSNDMLIITGKTFGITNVIMLDADRNIIQDQRILVTRDEVRSLQLMKGTKRESYNCAPQCNPSLVAGDDPDFFSKTAGSFSKKVKGVESTTDTSTPKEEQQ